MARSKVRNEESYRDTKPTNGELHVHFPRDTSARVIRICKIMNANKAKFVNTLLVKALDEYEHEIINELPDDDVLKMAQDALPHMSRDELINIILTGGDN